MDTIKHYTMHKTAPYTKGSAGPKCQQCPDSETLNSAKMQKHIVFNLMYTLASPPLQSNLIKPFFPLYSSSMLPNPNGYLLILILYNSAAFI